MRPVSASARRARPLLGTFVEIAAEGASPAAVHRAIDAAFDAVARVHHLMSLQEASSDLSRLNRAAPGRAIALHSWTRAVLRAALDLHAASGGLFDVTAPSRARGGDDLGFALLPGGRGRRTRPGAVLDLGGVAKGFAVDRAIAALKAHGTPRGIVNAGGDLAAFGRPGELVAIRDPRVPDRPLAHVLVERSALASSGGGPARTVDPRAPGRRPEILGATVAAPSCLLADALTKVVPLAGEAAGPLLARYGAAALFLAGDGRVHVTREWSGSIRRAS